MTLPPPNHRDLVITRAGANSLHSGWVDGATPAFDLLVTAYDERAPRAKGEMRVDLPGPKVAGYAELFRCYPDLLDRYERIALIDNDIESDAATLNGCFTQGKAEGLALWQPSLAIDSYFTYAMLLENPLFRLRFTDFVEMMCPFFDASTLRSVLPLFNLGYETGIDLAWASPQLVRDRKVAVLDTVSVRHTRPVGGTKSEQGFAPGEGYDKQIKAFLRSTGRSEFSYPRVVEGVLRDGTRIRSHPLIVATHMVVARAVWLSPETPKSVARSMYHMAGFGLGGRISGAARAA